jgi:hypothetical protein
LPDGDVRADWNVVIQSFFVDVHLFFERFPDLLWGGLYGFNEGGFLFFVEGGYVELGEDFFGLVWV